MMSEAVITALIVAIGPCLVGIASLITSIRHARHDRQEHEVVFQHVKDIKRMVNGASKEYHDNRHTHRLT